MFPVLLKGSKSFFRAVRATGAPGASQSVSLPEEVQSGREGGEGAAPGDLML